MRVHRLKSVPSTNAEGLRLAALGEFAPLWVVAEEQTAGKGRSGRAWASVPGNLYASLLIRPSCPPAQLGELSLVAGVSVIESIRASAGDRTVAGLRLKWPNDILVGTAKLGGILVESTDAGGSRAAVIGIGINLAGHPEGLGRAATDLAHEGLTLTPLKMLDFLGASMDTWLAIWDDGRGFATVRQAWQDRGGPMGEALSVNTGNGPVAGRYMGLGANGELLLEDETGELRRYTFGDVTVLAG